MLIVAHRGAWLETGVPEQTRRAFELALSDAIRADGIECDVRLTADGHVVCHHDATAERLTGTTDAIVETSLAELRALDWDATTGEGGASGGIVTLAELVDVCAAADRPVELAIELKHPNPSGTELDAAALGVLDELGWDPRSGRIGAVQIALLTFNPASLEVLLPRVPREHVTLLTADAALDDLAYALDTQDVDAATRASLEARLSEVLALGRELIDAGAVGGAGPDIGLVRREPEAIRRWVDRGSTVRVWTVDDEADADLCARLGVTHLETDRPGAMRRWRDGRA